MADKKQKPKGKDEEKEVTTTRTGNPDGDRPQKPKTRG
jgi:hypothetical protein